MIWALV